MTTTKMLLGAAVVLLSTGAFAGLYQPAPFGIDLDNQIAQGDMQSVRDSKDELAFIGCGIRTLDLGGGISVRFGFCQAGDAEVQVTCFTESPVLLDEMRAANDFSFITFSWQDDGFGGLECTRVGYSTQSFYLDKAKN